MSVSYRAAFVCVGVMALGNQGLFCSNLSKSTLHEIMDVLEWELEVLGAGSGIEEHVSDIASLTKRFERLAQKCRFNQRYHLASAESFSLLSLARCQQKTPLKKSDVAVFSAEDEEELKWLAGRIMYLRKKQENARRLYISYLISTAVMGLGIPVLMIVGGYVFVSGWPGGRQENSQRDL